ncbi:RNA polymerase sigma factor [Paludisphaera soli]|uniref:RNA polymerase sigma factor n=1 Tax=Paludisphaera soli TaxID=2712865 RepID=UPI0013EE1C0E|nr:sigma-70 family RNA polymerase sigma factor [Paludisphaera soli]
MPDADRKFSAHDEPSTDGILLARVRDWRDDCAWDDLVGRYDSLVRGWCRMAGVGRDDLDDVVQGVWLRLAGRIRGFAYDPSRRFRGWLRRVAANASVDFLRSRRRAFVEVPLDRIPEAAAPEAGRGGPDPLAERGRRIEESVRARFHETSWAAFRRCAIGDEPIADVARDLGMQYAAVYRAVDRIKRKLEEAGRADIDDATAPGGDGLD